MSANIELRPIIDGDLPLFFEFGRDPIAVRMAAFTAKDPSDHAAFLAHWERIRATPSVVTRTILADGAVVGSVLSYQEEGRTEVTYWIDRARWGKGIASAALATFIDLLDVRPLRARAAADNIGSVKVLERCGFRVIGHDRGFANARGEEIDELVLELADPR